MHGNRLSRLGISRIAIPINKDQPLRICECRQHIRNQHMVTAHGHLGKGKSYVKKAKVLISVTGGIVMTSKRHQV
jgi:hypothetical protein